MTRIEQSINIQCPVDKVFPYTTDVASWSKWQTGLTDAEQTSPGQMAIGTTFRWTSHRMGLRLKVTSKVTGYEPPKRWSKDIFTGSSYVDDTLSFDPIEGGTKFSLRWDVKTGGFLKLVSPMLLRSLRKHQEEALNNIKSILEAQT